MKIQILNGQTCCFSGHRPQSLPWGYNEESIECCLLKEKLHFQIKRAFQIGYNHFIIGMAQGIDMYAGEILISMKRIHPDITMEAAIPCANQTEKWPLTARDRYHHILSWCDSKVVLCEQYTPNCMQERNQYMVDKSTLLIAVWNGRPSGTGKTVSYAQQKGIKVVQINV